MTLKEIDKNEFKESVTDYMKVLFRKNVEEGTQQQLFQAVAYAVKDIVVDQWMASHKEYEENWEILSLT